MVGRIRTFITKHIIRTVLAVVAMIGLQNPIQELFKHYLLSSIIDLCKDFVAEREATMVAVVATHVVSVVAAAGLVALLSVFWFYIGRRSHPTNALPKENALSSSNQDNEKQNASELYNNTRVSIPIIPVPDIESSGAPERIFVRDNVTPLYLTNFFNDQTIMAAQRQTEVFIGKWIRIQGIVDDMYSSARPGYIKLLFAGRFESFVITQPHIFMTFGNPWVDRIKMLSRRDVVAVIGKIENIARNQLGLIDCELIN